MEKMLAIKVLFDIIGLLQRKTVLLLPLTLIAALLSGFFELATVSARPDEASKQIFFEASSWERSQDVTTDGDSYFFSNKYGLIKTESDGKTLIESNAAAIPEELAEGYDSAHIGGISYYDGKLYCALEDSKKWQHPIIAVYSARTLKYTGVFYHLDPTLHTRGLPWISVDPETGVIYCSSRDYSTEIMRYDPASQAYLEPIVLKNEDENFNIHKIQGGDVYDGMLYLATNNDTQAVYSVELATGEAKKLFDRNLFPGSEGEGLAVTAAGGSVMLHALDMSPIFITAYLRNYSLPQQ